MSTAQLRWLLLLALLSLQLLPSAWAGKRQPHPDEDDAVTARAKIHLESGVAYFNEGKFQDAEREMSQAYTLRPVPELKFNLGQCQERLGALDRAAASYRAYLEGRPGAADRANVERKIAQLDEQLRAQPRAPESPSEPPPAAQGPEPVPALVAPAVAEKVVFKEIVVYRAPPPKAGRTARFIGAGLLALAAVGLAGGITFSIAASNTNRDIIDVEQRFLTSPGMLHLDLSSCGKGEAAERALLEATLMAIPDETVARQVAMGACDLRRVADESKRFNQGAAAVGFAVAVASAAAATGTLLYARHLDKKQEKELAKKGRLPNLSLSPVLGPAVAGAILAGSF